MPGTSIVAPEVLAADPENAQTNHDQPPDRAEFGLQAPWPATPSLQVHSSAMRDTEPGEPESPIRQRRLRM